MVHHSLMADARLQHPLCGIASALLMFLSASPATVAEEVPTLMLPGNSATGAWSQLGKETLAFAVNDVDPWPKDLPAQSGEKRFLFRKVSGSAYAIANGLYSGGAEYKGPMMAEIMTGKITPEDLKNFKAEDFVNPGTFRVATTAPLKELQTVILLVRLRGLPPGEHFTAFELIQKAFPVILRTENGEKLAASDGRLLSTRLVDGFHEEIYVLQWNLNTATAPVKGYAIEWKVYPHASTTGVRVQESDSANRSILGVVPLLSDTVPKP